jgi:hypothetical protein
MEKYEEIRKIRINLTRQRIRTSFLSHEFIETIETDGAKEIQMQQSGMSGGCRQEMSMSSKGERYREKIGTRTCGETWNTSKVSRSSNDITK